MEGERRFGRMVSFLACLIFFSFVVGIVGLASFVVGVVGLISFIVGVEGSGWGWGSEEKEVEDESGGRGRIEALSREGEARWGSEERV